MEVVMTIARRIFAAALLTFVPALEAAAQDGTATEIWALDGLSTPESVVFDEEKGELYVSNIAGEATGKDGNGFLSRVSTDGEMLEAEWVTGLDAPKGLALDGSTLYVTDIDRLVAVDVASGEISNSWQAEGAQLLNDAAVDDNGRVFVSDIARSAIYVLDGDSFSVWVEDEALKHPNGLKVDDGKLIVAAWGEELQPDFSTTVPGHLLAVDLESKEISSVGSGEPIGNLDGLEPDGAGNWIATDWIAGAVLRIKPGGSAERLLDLSQGSADLEYLEGDGVVVIPMMMDDRLVAYKIE
jgi:sugar lactone lactonase YvrE